MTRTTTRIDTDTWTDPAVFAVNRLPGRSVIGGRAGVDPTVDEALASTCSPWCLRKQTP